MRFLPYLLAGLAFGFVMIKSEAASWYRIMEMFHFQAFHMYGIMMSAIVTGLAGVTLFRRYERPRTLDGDAIVIPQKDSGRYDFIFGGLIFGLGWGIIGLCPGPIFFAGRHGFDRRAGGTRGRTAWHLVVWLREKPATALTSPRRPIIVPHLRI
jgi:uncharacterized membrane protein YedE/YeeE